MRNIPVTEYLTHALAFTPKEERLVQVFKSWLPDIIVDCHAHCNEKKHVRVVDIKSFAHMLSTFTHHSLTDSHRLRDILYPEKTVHTLRFPKTFSGIDHKGANEYLLRQSPDTDRVAVFGLPEDIFYTTAMLQHPRCSALKMYHSYVEPTAERIYDFFKPQILEEAQARDIPIILHPPKTVVRSLADIVRTLEDFPRMRVVLAHLGLSKMPVQGLGEAYGVLARYENLMLDTALNPSADVVHLALTHFGAERVMFGSDEPLNLIRSVVYRHPDRGERLATDYLYHWVDPDEHATFKHLAKDAVHAHWQSLGAIREALARFPAAEQGRMKDNLFFKNAAAFFNF